MSNPLEVGSRVEHYERPRFAGFYLDIDKCLTIVTATLHFFLEMVLLLQLLRQQNFIKSWHKASTQVIQRKILLLLISSLDFSMRAFSIITRIKLEFVVCCTPHLSNS